MKKLIRMFLSLLCVLTLTAALWGLNVSAQSRAIIDTKTAVNVGEQVTVTATVTTDEAMYAYDGTLTIENQNVLKYVSGDIMYVSDDKLKVSAPSTGETSKKFSFNLSAAAVGSTRVTFSFAYSYPDAQNNYAKKEVSAGATITVAQPAPSSNAALSSLKISGGTLQPAFKATTTNYTVSVAENTEKITITALTADAGASFTGAGTVDVKTDGTKRNIVVTAADGKTKKTYTLTVRHAAAGEPVPETPADEDNIDAESLKVTIGTDTYRILTDLSNVPAPTGFTASDTVCRTQQIPAFQDKIGKYIIYCLQKDADAVVDYYTYDVDKDAFEPLQYISFSGKMYIMADIADGFTIPNGYYSSTTNIGGRTVRAYCSEDSRVSDFFYLYCYIDGKTGFYSYDTQEETLQRAPQIEPVTAVKEKQAEEINLMQRLLKLSTPAKWIAGLAVLAFICILALVILIIRLRSVRSDAESSGVYFSEDSWEDPFEETEETTGKTVVSANGADAADGNTPSEDDSQE